MRNNFVYTLFSLKNLSAILRGCLKMWYKSSHAVYDIFLCAIRQQLSRNDEPYSFFNTYISYTFIIQITIGRSSNLEYQYY